MTLEEFKKIPFKIIQHIAWKGTHIVDYKSEQIDPPIFCQTICRIKKNGDFGKTKRSYIYNGGVYNKVEQLLQAINGTEQSNASNE